MDFTSNQLNEFREKTRKELLKDVESKILSWWNDEKTCSGKPNCCIDECDLCVDCFDRLMKSIKELGDKNGR